MIEPLISFTPRLILQIIAHTVLSPGFHSTAKWPCCTTPIPAHNYGSNSQMTILDPLWIIVIIVPCIIPASKLPFTLGF